jgi:hypothetical protein
MTLSARPQRLALLSKISSLGASVESMDGTVDQLMSAWKKWNSTENHPMKMPKVRDSQQRGS